MADDQPQVPGSNDELDKLVKQCHQVLKMLQKAPAAGAFLAPVDWKALKLPTYPKMVKHPMDLGTVEHKLGSGKYNSVSDFSADVNQVWENAHIFNQPGSDIYDAATQLQLDFEHRMRAVPEGPLREGGGSSSLGLVAVEHRHDHAHVREVRHRLLRRHRHVPEGRVRVEAAAWRLKARSILHFGTA